MSTTTDKKVTFIQSGVPKLRAGEYTLTVTQAVTAKNTKASSGDTDTGTQTAAYTTSKVFAVKGERFSFKPDEFYGVFPPKGLTGEYDGVLPQVVLNKLTLPWERSIESQDDTLPTDIAVHTPWLAVLLVNADEAPAPADGTSTSVNETWPKVQKMTAKDLVPSGTPISVWGSTTTGTGALPANYLSYPNLAKLDYSETPDDMCNVIDVPIDLFNKIAPSVDDLYYLGHIREVDTVDSEDNPVDTEKYAVVVGNRLPAVGAASYAYLVSLEEMSDYLPSADGTPSSKIPAGTTHVRLITYVNWSFTANDLGQSFRKLLENVNQMAGDTGSSGLRLPLVSRPADGNPASSQPTKADVDQALTNQANGTLTQDNAGVLMNNAFNMGYVPFGHQLRHGGHTVSWYRGPLATSNAQMQISIPLSCADAANRFNPHTGLFDVSHGAAWQLGRLMALQNGRFSLSLYQWKKSVTASQVRAQEMALLNTKMQGTDALAGLLQPNSKLSAGEAPPLPDYVSYWLGRLRLLNGVPINYLVPNEQMLPAESIRFFYLDQSWVDALVDGAMSIGRSSTAELVADAEYVPKINRQAQRAARTHRPQAARQRKRQRRLQLAGKRADRIRRWQAAPRSRRRRMRLTERLAARDRRQQAAALSSTNVNDGQTVTGFLLRSQVVVGWPTLNVNGYNNPEGDPADEVTKLRMERIGEDMLICLFDGEVQMVAIHEAPQALHCGAEAAAAADKCDQSVTYVTTLRTLSEPDPGKQYLEGANGESPNACVPTRSDGQVIEVTGAISNIEKKLAVTGLTSAEFAVEMVKGVSKVEFYNPPPQISVQWQDATVNGHSITEDYSDLLAQKKAEEAKNQVPIS